MMYGEERCLDVMHTCMCRVMQSVADFCWFHSAHVVYCRAWPPGCACAASYVQCCRTWPCWRGDCVDALVLRTVACAFSAAERGQDM